MTLEYEYRVRVVVGETTVSELRIRPNETVEELKERAATWDRGKSSAILVVECRRVDPWTKVEVC